MCVEQLRSKSIRKRQSINLNTLTHRTLTYTNAQIYRHSVNVYSFGFYATGRGLIHEKHQNANV